MRIGVDAGGTFTDFFVLHDDGRTGSFKLRSDPRSPASVILAGLERAAGEAEADVVHGSTVATNAVLERKGVRTAFVTTAGFEDLIEIGRQNRFELYSLTPSPRIPPAPRELRFGVEERTCYDGAVLLEPRRAQVRRIARRLREQGARAVAVCLLHSYQNPGNEARVADWLGGADLYVSASHEISPEFREFERASTTLLNAYVGPLIEGYLLELERRCRHRLWIMQSNGGAMTTAEASRQAVRTVLSGPAGGVVGAIAAARASGFDKVLAFDMGGTSTDVSLADGAPQETTESYIERYPVRVPMLDIQTVGAGGGSIARVDAGGLLRVGPESAGAVPGPACYGEGADPTVTDAQVVLGRIAPEQFLGGEMRILPERSREAIRALGARLGLGPEETAAGILKVADANMLRAVRAISVERGRDPRDFALLAFGGGGGLHACDLAVELGIGTVIAPANAEVLSAVGMLVADRIRDYAGGVLGRGPEAIADRFRELAARARRNLPGARLEYRADLRYPGQSYELTVPWQPRDPARPFHAAHRRVYGFADRARAVEVVTIRVRARLATEHPRFAWRPAEVAGSAQPRRVWLEGAWRQIPVWRRVGLTPGSRDGPALILDYGSTTLVPSGWRFELDAAGNLVLRG
jgi:N-methylhydantoinase A